MSQHDYDQKPHITVVGVGGAGGNAVNNMIEFNLEGVDFAVANTDAQALKHSLCQTRVQLGTGLGAGAVADVGREAAEESADDIRKALDGANMAFITAGMGGGTGTGAAPVVAKIAKEMGILTIGVVTKPFHFEGGHRMRSAEKGIEALEKNVDTLIMIPNQNLFRVCDANTTFAEAFKMADGVLHAGVRSVTDLIVMPGLINLDFADIRSVMRDMGKAMMGMGEASGEDRATRAAQEAITNPLLDDVSMKGAQGVLINITGGMDMTLFEVDEVANRIREEVDPDAQIIFGSAFDENLDGTLRVSVVATGFDLPAGVRRKREEAGAGPERSQAARSFTVVDSSSDSELEDTIEPVADDSLVAGDAADRISSGEETPVIDGLGDEASDSEDVSAVDPVPDWLLPSGSKDEEPEDGVSDEPEVRAVEEEAEPVEQEEEEDSGMGLAAYEASSAEAEADAKRGDEAAVGGVDETLVNDVSAMAAKLYVESAAGNGSAKAERSAEEDGKARDETDMLAATVSSIWSKQSGDGGSSSNGYSGNAAMSSLNGSESSITKGLFLDQDEDGAEEMPETAEEGAEDVSAMQEDGEGAADGLDQEQQDQPERLQAAARQGLDPLDSGDDEMLSIEDDASEAEVEREQRKGFLSGLARGFGKTNRDEQTGKAVLERLRGCQRLNTGEAS